MRLGPRNQLLLLSRSNLGLGSSANLLHSVLLLLLLFPAGLCLGLDYSLSDQPELRLKFLGEVHGIVDEGESRALTTTKVSSETEGEDSVSGALVHGRQFVADRSLRNRRLSRMQNIDHQLPPGQQAISHELSCSDGNASVNHCGTSCRSESSNISLVVLDNIHA